MELSIEEKIGQMFIIALQENEITNKTIEMIQKYKIGGIILYRKNYTDYESMINLINKIKEINSINQVPIFITIDQEGGRVNRMPYQILNLKSANKIAGTEDISLVNESATIISKILKQSGINVNYAPVLDIKRFEQNHAIGDRCFGDNKDDVCKYGIEFMKKTQKQGVIPIIKHFPGHGATIQDSHMKLPIVKIKKEELAKEDMVPFEKAIENGADGIMVGHIMIKDMDSKYPASLSKKIIKTYLKEKYNYKGLIFTDDLKMLAIRLRYLPSTAAKLAIKAGNDVIMSGMSYGTIKRTIEMLARMVKNKKIDIQDIDTSVEKIIEMKKKYNITDQKIKGIDVDKINSEIEELNRKIK